MKRYPGKILLEEFLKPLKINPSQLAKGLGVHRSTIERLIAGKQGIILEMAARLGAYFQVPAKWWLWMQTEFDTKQIAAHPEFCKGVTPLQVDLDFFVTPKGVLHLGKATPSKSSPLSLS